MNDLAPDVRQGQMRCVLKYYIYIKANGEKTGGLMEAPSV